MFIARLAVFVGTTEDDLLGECDGRARTKSCEGQEMHGYARLPLQLDTLFMRIVCLSLRDSGFGLCQGILCEREC